MESDVKYQCFIDFFGWKAVVDAVERVYGLVTIVLSVMKFVSFHNDFIANVNHQQMDLIFYFRALMIFFAIFKPI